MDIKVEVRVSVTDAHGGDFAVVQERQRQFLGNPLLNASETDALIDSVREDLYRVMVARYGTVSKGEGR